TSEESPEPLRRPKSSLNVRASGRLPSNRERPVSPRCRVEADRPHRRRGLTRTGPFSLATLISSLEVSMYVAAIPLTHPPGLSEAFEVASWTIQYLSVIASTS